jgi:DNA invertase Pin-like site-specific DNA recombinase
MIYGYARVSTKDQNLERQIDALKQAGCEYIYEEKVSGTKREREELNKMLDNLKEGDTVIVVELTRISRSTKDLLEIVETITSKGANIKSLKESWLDTTSSHGKFLLTVFAGLSQLERDLIAERTKEGLEAARRRGRVGGRPKVKDGRVDMAIELYQQGKYSIKEICRRTGLARATLYRRLAEAGLK